MDTETPHDATSPDFTHSLTLTTEAPVYYETPNGRVTVGLRRRNIYADTNTMGTAANLDRWDRSVTLRPSFYTYPKGVVPSGLTVEATLENKGDAGFEIPDFAPSPVWGRAYPRSTRRVRCRHNRCGSSSGF